MVARIYRPARTAMQSGRAKSRDWLVEFMPETRAIEPLMGWTASSDTQPQVKLRFATREEAVSYCQRSGIPFQVSEPNEPARRKVSYSDNFAFQRVGAWTH
ncbi:ETC complex I subunit [Blastochloris sulfoviridis]|uniref:ETC complex I subunit n=1 Tax=Blastochloris sulfoviridis TaxID=50712 RepID=A0A5M6HTJ1_9HYPH|nr:ETC complex I subunit [Blastochloris sulfoviridis]KAA5599186.1 ETC complex I subunit [Blastochloris sulfoviridis]